MRLSDLKPELRDGVLCFDCPLGHTAHRLMFHIQRWSPTGVFPDSLTLTPSIQVYGGVPNDESLSDGQHKAEYDAAAACNWHGFITNGEVTNA